MNPEGGRPAVPVAVIAACAAVLQLLAVLAAPKLAPRPATPKIAAGTVLDLLAQPFIAIPVLEAAFVRNLLGGKADALTPATATPPPAPRVAVASGGRTPSPTSTPRPTPTPTPRPIPPLIPGESNTTTTYRTNRTVATADDEILYEVVVRNNAAGPYTASFFVTTHTPLGTFSCTTEPVDRCTIPGDYTGDSQASSDQHLNPPASQQTRIIPGLSERVVYTLHVRVAPGVPAGSRFVNHAHVAVVGGSGSHTYAAPDVVAT
jgi:hypothetical protein